MKKSQPEIEIKNIDLLDHASALIKFLYGKAYLDIIKVIPEFYAYNYKKYKSAQKFTKPRLLLDKVNLNDFFEIIDSFNPDLILATHFIPGAISANYKAKEKKDYKIAVTVTDHEYHPLWLVESADHFFCATDEVKESIIFYGITEDKITVSGIPVHPKFFSQTDKKSLRAKYELSHESPAILISAGSLGVTPLESVIQELCKIESNFQIMAVCGKNEELKSQLESQIPANPRLTKVFGFVDFMDELMSASDLLITKPGGITVSESLAVGLPMVLIEPIPGQEEANADYLVEQGVALKARNLPMLIFKTRLLLSNFEKLKQMTKNAKQLGKPQAAQIIVEKIAELL